MNGKRYLWVGVSLFLLYILFVGIIAIQQYRRENVVKNILYICNESTLGGAAQSLLDMLKALEGRNIRPIVVIPKEGTIEERLKEMAVPYYIVNFTNGYGKIGESTKQDEDNDFIFNYAAALELQTIIKTEHIDLIHINSSVSNVGAIAALMADIPFVWHFRELLEEDFSSEFWDKDLKVALINKAAAVITISKTVQQKYMQAYGVDSICIYDAVDIDRYKADINMRSFSICDRHRFIITGQITENKGQLEAIKAVRLLKDRGISNVELILAGNISQSYFWILTHYIQDNNLENYVSILPFQKNLEEIRRKCDYALTTSKFEALGRCTIEAMLAGQVVIGTDTGGTAEIIGEDGRRGYLYRQGNYISLADVVEKVISEDIGILQKCRRDAQDYAESMFSSTTYADVLIQVYGEAFRQKNPHDVMFLENLKKRYCNSIFVEKNREKKSSNYSAIIKKWGILEAKNRKIGLFLENKGMVRVGIYGMGQLGRKLYDELKGSRTKIVCIVDKNPGNMSEIIDTKFPGEILQNIDVLIIALSYGEDEVIKNYAEGAYAVYTIEQIIDEIMNEM